MRSGWGRYLTALAAVLAIGSAVGCADDESVADLPDAGSMPPADGGLPGNDAAAPQDTGVILSDAGATSDAASPLVDAGVIDQCNPVTQTGCTAPETKCVIEPDQENDGAHCVQPGNDHMLGETCDGEDCLAGLACVLTSTVATCVQVCDINGGTGCESLGTEYDCRTRVTGTNWGACSLLPPRCDPLTQTPCAPEEGCMPFTRRNNVRELRCREAGPLGIGELCGSSANNVQCQRGLVCIYDRGTMLATCRKYCGGTGDCTQPSSCTGTIDEPPFMYCVP
jgi:hypothetical protein